MKRRERKNTSKERTAKNHCEKCGFHIRGKNHEEGDHHKRGEKGKIKVGMGW